MTIHDAIELITALKADPCWWIVIGLAYTSMSVWAAYKVKDKQFAAFVTEAFHHQNQHQKP